MVRIVLISSLLFACTGDGAIRPKTALADASQREVRIVVAPVQIEAPVERESDELLLARVLVSEASFQNRQDGAAIWEVVQAVRSRRCDNRALAHLEPAKQISACQKAGDVFDVDPGQHVEGAAETYGSAIRRLSRRATGTIEAGGRYRWISTLQPDGSPPTGWVECDGSGPCDGRWELFRRRWLGTLEFASRLVAGEEARACVRTTVTGPPIAWGNAQDRWLARRRGLVPINCGRTHNEFFARPRISLPAPPP